MAGKTGRIGGRKEPRQLSETLQFNQEIFHEHAARYLILLVEDGYLVVYTYMCIRNSCMYSIAKFLSASPFVAMLSLAIAATTIIC